ncbi:hypothetical protein RQ479_29665 [Mesorhizobium sp. ISC25]|uniref:hypothetical protein n=1 Tax=Mesorhizobium sp. ISC25 TaxID=3077335 RepID=UPI0035E3426C
MPILLNHGTERLALSAMRERTVSRCFTGCRLAEGHIAHYAGRIHIQLRPSTKAGEMTLQAVALMVTLVAAPANNDLPPNAVEGVWINAGTVMFLQLTNASL